MDDDGESEYRSLARFYAGRKYTALTGAAGEYYVAAELSRRGWAASITPKGVERNDVFAQHVTTQAVVAIQVKTSVGGPTFRLSAKNELPTSATNEWYALVRLSRKGRAPDVLSRAAKTRLLLLTRSWLGRTPGWSRNCRSSCPASPIGRSMAWSGSPPAAGSPGLSRPTWR